MITLGLMGCVVAACLLAAWMAFPNRRNASATYRRVAWVPVAALLVDGALWKPVLSRLSYFAVVPLLLPAIASAPLAVVGVTLIVAARKRREDATALTRSTLIAATPGMLLLAVMLYGFVNAILGSPRRWP